MSVELPGASGGRGKPVNPEGAQRIPLAALQTGKRYTLRGEGPGDTQVTEPHLQLSPNER